MLVKWITCGVPPVSAGAFSAAQARWSALRDVPGLLCQIGGWDGKDTACLLAAWADRDAYETFQREHHDRILAANGQAGTYDTADIAVGTVLQTVPGTAGDPVAGLCDAAVLRVADCRVRPGRDTHFRDVQRMVWVPGMTDADGMLGGVFSWLGGDRYLVTTGWRDAESHRRYVADRLPLLRDQADAAADLAAIRGHTVTLLPAWLVGAGPR